MAYKNILVVSDNLYLRKKFIEIADPFTKAGFTYTDSPSVNLVRVFKEFDLIISLHSRKVFPKEVVKKVKCINIHPGYNPHNRGFGSQVFSIVNKRPFGVTIHEMDERIDHGPIIDQVEVPIYQWDTSSTVYERMLVAEVGLIRKNLEGIINGTYSTREMFEEGNFNSIKDFDRLCELNLYEAATFGEVIDRLRALTHNGYDNAFFIDRKTQKKVYVSIDLKVE
jgi:methionyl-tRNA formyltransferase